MLQQVLLTYWQNLKFLKDRTKDVIAIRSLAECHESVNADGRNLLVDPLDGRKPGLAQLPEPMKRYVARKGRL